MEINYIDVLIKIPELEINLNNLDIAFKIEKNSGLIPNTAQIIIWNLSNSLYNQITSYNGDVELYALYNGEIETLIFKGKLDRKNSQRNRGANSNINNNSPLDIKSEIHLIDAISGYNKSFINKNYREEVSSTNIIKDCVKQMGCEIKLNTKIPKKFYRKYKAFGAAQVVLNKICQDIGVIANLSNNIVEITTPEFNKQKEPAINLNNQNSHAPQTQSSGEILIETGFLPAINILDLANCDFEEIQGLFTITQILITGNNYNSGIRTVLSIGEIQ